MAEIRFFWNGLKIDKGNLQRASYSDGELRNFPAGTVTIYARSGVMFSAEVHAAFKVENDSDGMTDYFESDRIRVLPTHPLYQKVKEALADRNAHYSKTAREGTSKDKLL